MKYTFNMQLIDGNPVIQHNGKNYLVDTGNPVTIGNETIREFCGKDWPVRDNFMGASIDSISNMVDSKLDAIIGLDIMSKYIVAFDYNEGTVTFGTDDEVEDGLDYVPINSSVVTGVTTTMVIDGQPSKCILDSGARISYLMGELPQDAVLVGHETDYHPLAHQFETDVYEAQASVSGKTFRMHFGKLPTLLEMSLGLAKVKAVVGCDLLSQYKVVVDFPHNRLALD